MNIAAFGNFFCRDPPAGKNLRHSHFRECERQKRNLDSLSGSTFQKKVFAKKPCDKAMDIKTKKAPRFPKKRGIFLALEKQTWIISGGSMRQTQLMMLIGIGSSRERAISIFFPDAGREPNRMLQSQTFYSPFI